MLLVERPVVKSDDGESSQELGASGHDLSNSSEIGSLPPSVAEDAPQLPTSNEPPAEADAMSEAEAADDQPRTPQPPATEDATSDGPLSDTVEDLSVYGTQPDEVPLPEIPASLMSEQLLLPNEAWSSESSQRVRNWLLLGGAATVGIFVAVGAFALVAMSLSKDNVVVEAPSDTTKKSGDNAQGPGARVDPSNEGETKAGNGNPSPGVEGSEGPESVTTKANSSDDGTPAVTPAPDVALDANPPLPDADHPPDFVDAEANDDVPPDFVASVDTAESADAALEKTVRNLEGLLNESPAEAGPLVPPLADIEYTETGPVRPAARVINVAERLADSFEEIQFDGTPLNDFLRFVADFSTIPITLDPDALMWLDATPVTPVSAHRKAATVKDLLQAVVESVGLTTLVVDNQMLVTLPEAGIHEELYATSDLAGSDTERLALARLVAELVARDSWLENGGLGSIAVGANGLAIRQSTLLHRQILRFLERLRIARGLSPVSSFPVANFDLASRFARVNGQLEKKIAVNFFQPTRLDRVTEVLSKIGECRILIDWQSLHQAGWNSDTMVTLTVSDTSLGTVLGELLEPMGLGVRYVDTGLLQITTAARLERTIELEIYPISDLLARRSTAEEIIAVLREAVGAELFSDRGGVGSLTFDERSGALLAALTQESQIVLEQSLAELRAKSP
jgi:hypothetical protein